MYTGKQVAEKLGITTQALGYLRKIGRIRPKFKKGPSWYDEAEVDELVRAFNGEVDGYTVKQFAKKAGLAESYIGAMIASGRFKVMAIGRRGARYLDKVEVDKFLMERNAS